MAMPAAAPSGSSRIRIKGRRASVIRFFLISVAFMVLWIVLTAQLGFYSKLFGPEILLQLNVAYYVPSIPVLLLSAPLEKLLDRALGGPVPSLLARLTAGLAGCLAIAVAFPFLPPTRSALLGAVVALGAVSALAFSTSYQLVSWFRSADTIALGIGCVGSGPLVLLLQLGLGIGGEPARWQWVALYEVSAGMVLVGLLAALSLFAQYYSVMTGKTPYREPRRRGATAAAAQSSEREPLLLASGEPGQEGSHPGGGTAASHSGSGAPGASAEEGEREEQEGGTQRHHHYHHRHTEDEDRHEEEHRAMARHVSRVLSVADPFQGMPMPPRRQQAWLSHLPYLPHLRRASSLGSDQHAAHAGAAATATAPASASAAGKSFVTSIFASPRRWRRQRDAAAETAAPTHTADSGAPSKSIPCEQQPQQPLQQPQQGEGSSGGATYAITVHTDSSSNSASVAEGNHAAEKRAAPPMVSPFAAAAAAGPVVQEDDSLHRDTSVRSAPAAIDTHYLCSTHSDSAAAAQHTCTDLAAAVATPSGGGGGCGRADPAQGREGEHEKDANSAVVVQTLEAARLTAPVLAGFLTSVTILNLVFPFFTYVPPSGALGDRLPQALFFARIFSDIAGRSLPRLLPNCSPVGLLALSGNLLWLLAAFLTYIRLLPQRYRSDGAAVVLVAAFWLVGGYVNTMANILAPNMVRPGLVPRASALVALVFQVGHFAGLLLAGLLAVALYGEAGVVRRGAA